MVASLVLGALLLAAAPERAYGIDFADPQWRLWLSGEAAAVSYSALDRNDDGVVTALEAKGHPLVERSFLGAALELAQGQDEESLVSGTLGATVVERDARVVVRQVGRGTPAARSGLRPGDVVLELDGEAITRSREFYRRVLDTPPGSMVELTIERSGEAKRLRMRVRPIDTTPRA